jgi:hypothetical protein
MQNNQDFLQCNTFDVNYRWWNAKQIVELSLMVMECFVDDDERRARCCDMERQLGRQGSGICAGQSLMRGV